MAFYCYSLYLVIISSSWLPDFPDMMFGKFSKDKNITAKFDPFDSRLNWSKCKAIPEKSFLKLVAGEEAQLARSEKIAEKIEFLIEKLIEFTNEKESRHGRHVKMITEMHGLQRQALADMIQARVLVINQEN